MLIRNLQLTEGSNLVLLNQEPHPSTAYETCDDVMDENGVEQDSWDDGECGGVMLVCVVGGRDRRSPQA